MNPYVAKQGGLLPPLHGGAREGHAPPKSC